jgi:hypothetical protein
MSNSSIQTRAMPNGVFRLLVPASQPTPPGTRSIELQGRHWLLTELTFGATDTPEYICVSYAWGRRKKTVNPFDENQLMSDRTILAIEATIRTRKPKAIWIDALCVPSQEPARAVCLQNMGAIYGNASQVVVVLSKSSSVLLEQFHRSRRIDTATLLVLENDDWITRAWTYQEIVNSKSIHFIAEGGSEVSVSGDDLLNGVGQAIDDYKRLNGFDSFKLRSLHPRLDSLEDVIADWLISERTAYQVMSAMDRRVSEREDDQFYAMVGAITATPFYDQEARSVHPAEYFMQICESKGDYSFIYSTSPRSEISGKCWRPVIGPIHAIFPWHTYGKGQSGNIFRTHIQLNNMCRMIPGSVDPTARQQLVEMWLQADNAVSSSDISSTIILQRLREAGFSGCGDCLELTSGYFFPQTPLTQVDEVRVFVAIDVRWAFGAPGILVKGNSSDIHHFSGVGVFVGLVPRVGMSINIGRIGRD